MHPTSFQHFSPLPTMLEVVFKCSEHFVKHLNQQMLQKCWEQLNGPSDRNVWVVQYKFTFLILVFYNIIVF